MREYLKFYIDGQWVDPVQPNTLDVDNPRTEQVSGKISIGSAADVDAAVRAARRAFASWSQTSREERLDVLQAMLAEYQKRAGDLADAVSEEMGAPPSLAACPQVNLGLGHLVDVESASPERGLEIGAKRRRVPGHQVACPALPGDPATAPPSYRYFVDMVAKLAKVQPQDFQCIAFLGSKFDSGRRTVNRRIIIVEKPFAVVELKKEFNKLGRIVGAYHFCDHAGVGLILIPPSVGP